MAREPYSPYPDVTPTGPSGAMLDIRASPSDFGALQAQGVGRLGAGLDQAGANLSDAALRMQAMNNEAAARDASNKFMQQSGQAWSQYGTLQGKAATDAYPQFAQSLQDIQQQHASTLASPQAKNDFLNASSYMLNRLTLMASTHAAQQQQQYWKSSHAANIENTTQFGVLMQNDPQTVDAAAHSVADSVDQIGHIEGWDPERVQAETSNAVGRYYRTVIESQAARDPVAAQETFSRVRGRMDAVSIAETDRLLKPAMDNAAVAGSIDAILRPGGGATGAPTSRDNNVGNIRASNATWEGKGAPAGGFETFSTPEQGVKAAVQNLQFYAGRNGGSITLQDALSKWAPKGDGDNDPVAYAAAVSRETGIKPSDNIPLNDPAAMASLVKAMTRVEKGRVPFTDDVFKRGADAALSGATIPAAAGAPDEGIARAQAIPSRYFDEIQTMQRAYQQTANMRPELRERVINGVFSQIQHTNALENQAESRADKNLSNFQRDTESILMGHAILGEPISDQDLGNMVRTQQISITGYNGIKAIQQKQAEGVDKPTETAQLWSKVENGSATNDDIFNSMLAGNIKGTTANEMVKAASARAKTQTNAVEKGAYDTLKSAIGGHMVEQGLVHLDNSAEVAQAQLWTQAQGEWNKRVLVGHEDPQNVLDDMLPRYQKAAPVRPDAWPNPRFGQVHSVQDVAAVAQKTRQAFQDKQISQDVFNEEGTLLNRYLTYYQADDQRRAATVKGRGPGTGSTRQRLPLAPSDDGGR